MIAPNPPLNNVDGVIDDAISRELRQKIIALWYAQSDKKKERCQAKEFFVLDKIIYPIFLIAGWFSVVHFSMEVLLWFYPITTAWLTFGKTSLFAIGIAVVLYFNKKNNTNYDAVIRQLHTALALNENEKLLSKLFTYYNSPVLREPQTPSLELLHTYRGWLKHWSTNDAPTFDKNFNRPRDHRLIIQWIEYHSKYDDEIKGWQLAYELDPCYPIIHRWLGLSHDDVHATAFDFTSLD